MPKVSIITVTYNCENVLQETIDSISSQTFKDYEYVVIDGNSTDRTVDIIKQNRKLVDYYISEPDKGIYDAMNKGMKVAKGKYIIFMNAGDPFYKNTALAKIPFDKFPDADIFYGETMIKDEAGNEKGLRRKKLPHNLNWKHFKRGMVVCHQSIFVKRELAPYYDLKYTYTADIDWVLKSLKNSSQNINTKSIISNFVEGGFSGQNQHKSWKDRFVILKNNFGLIQTMVSHIVFIFENLLIKVKLLPLYRKLNNHEFEF